MVAAKMKIGAGSSFRLGYLLHDVARLRRTLVDKALKPLGVTRSQWWVLANLSRYSEEGLMQTELAAAMDVGKVALGGMLDRLEANGHVQRRIDAQDRRAKLLTLTPKGAALLAAIEHRASALNRVMTRGLTIEHIAITEDTLQSLKERLMDMDRKISAGENEDDEPRPLY